MNKENQFGFNKFFAPSDNSSLLDGQDNNCASQKIKNHQYIYDNIVGPILLVYTYHFYFYFYYWNTQHIYCKNIFIHNLFFLLEKQGVVLVIDVTFM